MKTPQSKRRWLMIGYCMLLLLWAVATWLFQEVECLRIGSPNRQHTAVVTYRRYELFQTTFPGQSEDKSGFIRIEDKNGINYGRIEIPMVSMARDLEWTHEGARL
jgi:hypothetical protein